MTYRTSLPLHPTEDGKPKRTVTRSGGITEGGLAHTGKNVIRKSGATRSTTKFYTSGIKEIKPTGAYYQHSSKPVKKVTVKKKPGWAKAKKKTVTPRRTTKE